MLFFVNATAKPVLSIILIYWINSTFSSQLLYISSSSSLELKSDELLDHERFLNLHGQKLARLNRDQSIHPERKRTYLMTVISPFLLYGPEVYLRKLREITVDCLVNNLVWKDLLKQLTADWKEFTLYVRLYYLSVMSLTYMHLLSYRLGNRTAKCQRCVSGNPKCRFLSNYGSSFRCPESKLLFDSNQHRSDSFGFAFS